MDARKRIEDATGSGEILTIIYHGGSKPGTKREIAPISIKNGKVKAKCLVSNTTKLFLLNKIDIFNLDGESALSCDPAAVNSPPPKSFNDFRKSASTKLIKLGWHVEQSESSISIHRIRKNGKPLSGPDVSLVYEKYTSEAVFDFASGECREEDAKERVRPWSVRGKNKATASYKSFLKPAEIFLQWAQELPPH